VVHPGSGDNFPGRRWSESGFAALARHAVERRGARTVVTGSAAEADLCERVARAAGPGVTNLAGRLSLEGLVALLARAAAVVSNDTGPVHLASALHRPVLALFGPNTPVRYGPVGAPIPPGAAGDPRAVAAGEPTRSGRSVALYKALPCSPCLTEANYRSSRCRIHSCMAAISTGEAVAALESILPDAAAHSEPTPWPAAARR
jgi:ADP-heptose:LPS heptosyltransferase